MILVLKASRESRVRQALRVQLEPLALLVRLALRVFRASLAQPEPLVTLALLVRQVRPGLPERPALLVRIQQSPDLLDPPGLPERPARPELILSLRVPLALLEQLELRVPLVLTRRLPGQLERQGRLAQPEPRVPTVLLRLVLVPQFHLSRVTSGLILMMASRTSTTIASGSK